MKEISVHTDKRCCMKDITREVSRVIEKSGARNGTAVVFVPHTTAGITINENADPDVQSDILMKLGKMVEEDAGYRHAEGNSSAHIKAVMTGFSVTVIIESGKPLLGTWQGIYLCEFDGPRDRKIWIEIQGA